VGDVIEVPSSDGTRRLPVLGVFRDFNTGNYSLVMALELYRQGWNDRGLSGIGIDLRDDADATAVENELRTILTPATDARIRSSAAIQRLSLEVFDRTFSITEVLRVLAAVVAFLGVLSALLALELERGYELGVLRALGFSPRELTQTSLVQTGLLGIAAGLMAMPLGTVLAALLVHVINKRSFGWSMDFVITGETLLEGLALAVIAALVAGVYPAWRASRGSLNAALRDE
jgi:putative ABC transport system permease protein